MRAQTHSAVITAYGWLTLKRVDVADRLQLRQARAKLEHGEPYCLVRGQPRIDAGCSLEACRMSIGWCARRMSGRWSLLGPMHSRLWRAILPGSSA